MSKLSSKVSIKDRILWKAYASQMAFISSVTTLFSFFFTPAGTWKHKMVYLFGFIAVLVIIFLWNWRRANYVESAELVINGTKVNVKIGDLFAEEGLKIIGVNNYIDLIADDIKISRTTLHGKFIMQHENEIDDIEKAIINSNTVIPETNSNEQGQRSYDYGSCVLYKDFVLTVLTKFDCQNRAKTNMQEYVQFWMSFWNNIDAIYNSRTINIPIMGAGQTRFDRIIPEKQELLEIALWTLKISGFCNHYTDKSINFIVYEGDKSKINFYRIQKKFNEDN